MASPTPQEAGQPGSVLPWVLGALLIVLGVLAFLLWSTPEENTLPEVYEVM